MHAKAIWRRLIPAAWLALAPATPLAAGGLTPELLAEVREIVGQAMSPDGSRAVFELRSMREAGEPRSDLWIVPADGSAEARPFVTGEADDTAPAWAPDGRSVAFLSTRGEDGRRQLYRQGLEGEGPVRLTITAKGVDRFAWSPDGARIAFMAAPRTAAGGSGKGLWLLELERGSVRALGLPKGELMDFTWSPDGRELAVIVDNRLLVLERDSGRLVRVLHESASKPWSRRQVFDWSPDGRRILFAELAPKEVSPAGIGFWMAVVPAAGGAAKPVLKDYPGTVTQANWDADSRHLVAQVYQGTASKLIRIEPDSGAVSVLVDEILAEKHFDMSRDGRHFVYSSESPAEPADLWSWQAGAGKRRLTRLHPELTGLALGEVREVRWRNEEGETLFGVLVTPPGHEPGRRLPMVVQLHGGPHYAWWRGWFGDWHDWAQLLAQRGYAVFLPNPRGSTGKGLAFSLGNVNDIALGPLADVLAGVDMLIEEGVADPQRLGVGGWSYGGYLAAWTITQTPRFKAAVVGAGISRVTSRSRMLLKEYYENIPARERYVKLTRVSPDHFLHQVVTPTLVIHGAEDAKISHLQGRELHDGLIELGVDSELVIYPREGHGIHEREHRIDMLNRIVAWFDRYLR